MVDNRLSFKIVLPNSRHLIIIMGKNRTDLGTCCWLPPEKSSVCPKNHGFVRLRGLQPPHPRLVRLLCSINVKLDVGLNCSRFSFIQYNGYSGPWWLQRPLAIADRNHFNHPTPAVREKLSTIYI